MINVDNSERILTNVKMIFIKLALLKISNILFLRHYSKFENFSIIYFKGIKTSELKFRYKKIIVLLHVF